MKITKRVGTTRVGKSIIALCREFWPGDNWDAMTEGLGYRVVFEKIKPHQSDAQRGYYWASMTHWGREIGYSAKETEMWLHNAVLCEAFGVKETRSLRGMQYEIPKLRSSRLSRDDYSLLIETMLRMAAEMGITLPEAA